MTVLSGLKRGVAFAVALVCVNTGLVLATNVPVTVVKDTDIELELSWDTDSFTDGVSHTLNAPGSLTYWSIGPNGPVGGSPVVLGNILLNYLGGGPVGATYLPAAYGRRPDGHREAVFYFLPERCRAPDL